jgi:hypothetical protein
MKLTIPQLREIIKRSIKEARSIQDTYRRSYDKMIKKASTGGNKNTPPFIKKAAKAGKSGLGPF